MKTTTLPRRLLAGAAGLAVGLGGVIALATPAMAVEETVVQPSTPPAFSDTCDGTYVTVANQDELHDWSITAGGTLVWPLGEEKLPKFESHTEFVPAGTGEIEVGYGVDAEGWPKTHTWEEPEWCERLPEPTHTQPTCDDPGEITIPALPEQFAKSEVSRAPERGAIRALEETVDFAPTFFYTLNDENVDPESTHPVEPGTHVVKLHVEVTYNFGDAPVSYEMVLKTWTIEIEAPDCEGEGGELPETGAPIALITGAALLLLALGGASYILARRRRVTFTA